MKKEGSYRRLEDPLASAMHAVIDEQLRIARNYAARSLVKGLGELDPELVIPGEEVRAGSGWGK